MSLQSSGSVRVGAAPSSTVPSGQRSGTRAGRTGTRVWLVANRFAHFLQLSRDRRQGQFWIHRGFPLYRARWKLATFESYLPCARAKIKKRKDKRGWRGIVRLKFETRV